MRQGQNPNDGVALPQGVLANLLLGGSAGGSRALGLHLDPGVMQNITLIGTGIASLLGILLRDRGATA